MAALAACDLGQHAVPDGGNVDNLPASTQCSLTCHGTGNSTAPPRDTFGRGDTSSVGVGAHTAHLSKSTWHKQFACESCHKVPLTVGDLGHIVVAGANGTQLPDPWPAEVIFTGLGTGAAWDHDTMTCTSSYCHGDTLHQTDPTTHQIVPGAGGTITQPMWTLVDQSQSKCGACHGTPPPAPHPQNNDCGLCHQSMNPGDFAAGKISYPELHINGKVEVTSTAPCDTCHGSGGQYAPPKDAHGNVATTAIGVGAHAQHMTNSSTWHAAIQCNECHLVPGSSTDQTHLDSIDEVYMDPTISIPGSPTGTGGHLQVQGAAWNSSAMTCTNTYCHGGGLSPLLGGTKMTPKWTQVDGTQSQCGSCHGNPPPAPHPVDGNCGKCHPTMVAGANTTIAYPAKHIDGNVDVINDQPCNACHGNVSGTPVAGDNAVNAPPTDTTGGTSTNLRSVGAHQAHMLPGGSSGVAWHAQISCGECHKVPTSLLSIGHVDTPLPAEVIFGNLAGTTSTWNGSTCSNTYCHGATLNDGGGPAGGTATTPVWTRVDGSQSQCGSCHGLPPGLPHPADADCGKCHTTMTAGQPNVITDPTRHIDGNLDVNTDQPCNTCHGTAGTPASNSAAMNAPPKDSAGNTLTTARGVGAHQSHLAPASPIGKLVLCQDCHTVPATVNSVGHIDHPLPAYVIFSSRAGSAPTWNGATCANVYCHGSTLTDGTSGAGGTATSPVWGKVDGTQKACTSCHGNPPPLPHVQNPACQTCHTDMSSPTVFSDVTKHIDGNLDVNANQACNACHGNHTGTPVTNSDAINAPPFDSTATGSATTLRGVGAHQSHLKVGSTWHADVTCGECHSVPATVNSVGHMDHPLPATMAFTGVGAGTTWNGSTCSSPCHGTNLTGGGGGTAVNPLWTKVDGTQSTCTSCHGDPPPAPHPASAVTACNGCHAGTLATGLIDPTKASLHINGIVDVTSGSNHPAGYQAVTSHGYDADSRGFATCATAACHGTALTGGSTGGNSCASTTGCHDKVVTGYSWQTQCTFCHGDITTPSGNGAPPQGVEAATVATDKTVGAHQKHVLANTTATANSVMHAAFDCTMCHVKPTSALNPGHVDGTGSIVQAEVKFSTLNPSSVYSFTAYTCATNYCHGTGAANGTSPAWTSTTALTCTSCHGAPPGTGKHNTSEHRLLCASCHSQTMAASSSTVLATGGTYHLNGTKEVKFSGQVSSGTYTASSKACSGLPGNCHGTKTW